METIKKFFKSFDMFTAPATLRVFQEPEISSLCAGITSFLIAGLFTYVFISQVVTIISFGDINAVQTQTKLLGDDPSAKNIFFAIMVNYMDWETASKYFSVTVTAFAITDIYNIQMGLCTLDQWSLLGQSYQTIFDQFGLGSFLCPTSSENLNLQGTFKKDKIKQIKIIVEPCGFKTGTNQTNTSVGSTCANLTQQQSYISTIIRTNRSMLLQIYFLDQSLNTFSEIPVSYFVNNDNRVSFTDKQGVDNLIEFGSYQIQTDKSLFPWEDKQTINGSFIDKIKNSAFQINTFGSNPYVVTQLIMDRRMIKLTRNLGKIDETLSYAGGLFAIIIAFLAFFISSYNQYRYELIVAEGSFNYNQQGKRIREKDFHFIDYVKYSIYDWINTLFCTQINWTYCQQIDQTRQQSNCQMDVVRMFRKIRNLETAVLYLMSQNERICLTLFQPPALPQVRRNRLICEYYDAIIGGEAAVTVEDVQMVKNTLKLGIKLAENKYIVNDQGLTKVQLFEDKESNQQQQIREQIREEILIKPNRQNILQVVLKNFPQYKRQAQQIQLPEELQQIQAQIADAFFKMQVANRRRIQQKIPLKIVHRLKIKYDQLNQKIPKSIQLLI